MHKLKTSRAPAGPKEVQQMHEIVARCLNSCARLWPLFAPMSAVFDRRPLPYPHAACEARA